MRSRGDLAGKALAEPSSQTQEERYEVLRWPSPATVRSRISKKTGGAFNTPAELYAKARRQPNGLTNGEVLLIANNFCY